MRAITIAAICGGAALLLLWRGRRRRQRRSSVIRLTAGPHVRDLLDSETTWRKIRPRHPPSDASRHGALPPAGGLRDTGHCLKLDPSTGRPYKAKHKVYAGVT